jgi:hypothetical protein
MSQTISIGVVGERYWLFSAKVMAECLTAAINNQKTTIPINVFRDTISFFKLVLGKKTGRIIFDYNPEAQSKAYEIAIEILNRCKPYSPDEARRLFQEFHRFLETLEKEAIISSGNGWGKPIPSLNQNNRKMAAQLRDFFAAFKEGRD